MQDVGIQRDFLATVPVSDSLIKYLKMEGCKFNREIIGDPFNFVFEVYQE